MLQQYIILTVFCNTVKAQNTVVQPYGIESVDGSDINMGCTSPLVDRGGVMICMSQSYLVDGCSPAINTSTSDWASQLVTVRKTQNDRVTDAHGDPLDHVLLTFGFDTSVRLTGIELDLFLCPDMNIGASFITLYANKESDLTFSLDDYVNNSDNRPHQNYYPSQSSCDSLSTITITFINTLARKFLTWHILISAFTSSIDWVYVGDVRFLRRNHQHQMTCIVPSVTSSSTECQCFVYNICSMCLFKYLFSFLV